MRIIDPERIQLKETKLCNLLPGDVVYMLGEHYLITQNKEDSYITCVRLRDGMIANYIENRECLPIIMEAVIK